MKLTTIGGRFQSMIEVAMGMSIWFLKTKLTLWSNLHNLWRLYNQTLSLSVEPGGGILEMERKSLLIIETKSGKIGPSDSLKWSDLSKSLGLQSLSKMLSNTESKSWNLESICNTEKGTSAPT
jgi:hypothetical protein